MFGSLDIYLTLNCFIYSLHSASKLLYLPFIEFSKLPPSLNAPKIAASAAEGVKSALLVVVSMIK